MPFSPASLTRLSPSTPASSFGGRVVWDDEADSEGRAAVSSQQGVTHHVVDRPPLAGIAPGPSASSSAMPHAMAVIQPQWVYDSANARLLLPTDVYGPGRVPPPHLSPFVDHGVEG